MNHTPEPDPYALPRIIRESSRPSRLSSKVAALYGRELVERLRSLVRTSARHWTGCEEAARSEALVHLDAIAGHLEACGLWAPRIRREGVNTTLIGGPGVETTVYGDCAVARGEDPRETALRYVIDYYRRCGLDEADARADLERVWPAQGGQP